MPFNTLECANIGACNGRASRLGDMLYLVTGSDSDIAVASATHGNRGVATGPPRPPDSLLLLWASSFASRLMVLTESDWLTGSSTGTTPYLSSKLLMYSSKPPCVMLCIHSINRGGTWPKGTNELRRHRPMLLNKLINSFQYEHLLIKWTSSRAEHKAFPRAQEETLTTP